MSETVFDRYLAALGADTAVDQRTIEEIEVQIDEHTASLRETFTGLPARPGVIR